MQEEGTEREAHGDEAGDEPEPMASPRVSGKSPHGCVRRSNLRRLGLFCHAHHAVERARQHFLVPVYVIRGRILTLPDP